MIKPKTALVLYSGGIDSTTALYWARDSYAQVRALSFNYGQRHKVELSLARRLTGRLRVPHTVLKIDLRQIGGSALTDASIPLPRFRRPEDFAAGIPLTYVPFRNGIFLALAAAWAEARGPADIVCGFNTIDSPHYPDTRGSFIRAMERAIDLGTGARSKGRPIRIIAPLLRMRKSEIIRKGLSLGADYSFSVSCYGGSEVPCRRCSSCLLRQRAWREVGTTDHLLVRLRKEGKI
ncbi:MAG TPA: 7-cyano-7-deazaguanine synthase QueC [Candidatus Desulfaltia sp.]|nr:7-cyano-7-deazaguanine synthase QueC [Candidatus Desulfaltia sp.]